MEQLPVEILELISIQYADLCISMILAFNLSSLSSRQRFLKERFTRRTLGQPVKYVLPDGQLHRENDLPAVIWSNGLQFWYYNDLLHRENDQPAIMHHDGSQSWYYNDKLHRENDQPAVVYSTGSKEWWYGGKRHRENNRPAVIRYNGEEHWWCHGELIR